VAGIHGTYIHTGKSEEIADYFEKGAYFPAAALTAALNPALWANSISFIKSSGSISWRKYQGWLAAGDYLLRMNLSAFF
jgi:hypothetical protein